MAWTWQDISELAEDLAGTYPEKDPLRLSTKDVHRLVVAMPTFGDEPAAATESILESIQAAWFESKGNPHSKSPSPRTGEGD
jgi:FeS assembly protein IscX